MITFTLPHTLISSHPFLPLLQHTLSTLVDGMAFFGDIPKPLDSSGRANDLLLSLDAVLIHVHSSSTVLIYPSAYQPRHSVAIAIHS